MANSESVHGGSELPEAIIQRILSLLTSEDAIRASSLSKTWLNAWQTRSILHFDEHLYYEQVLGIRSWNEKRAHRGRFLNYVNRFLQRYREQKIGIENFNLNLFTSLVNEWIEVAIENGVKKLELVCDNPTLPRIIFEAKSLLELSAVGNYAPLKLPRSIKCHNLRSLHLRGLCLDESKLQNIFSNCQMIEDLELWSCSGIDNFKVTKVPKLKQFLFHPPEAESWITVQVEAPNLEFFTCPESWNWLSLNTSQNLKQLVLHGVGVTAEFFFDFKYKFPHLEDLEIRHCPSLHRRIRISSASLRKMVLDMFGWGGLLELHIDAPSLTMFEYNGSLIPRVSFTSSSSHCCSHIITGCATREAGTSWFVNLKGFLKSFSPSTIYLSLSISTWMKDVIFDVEETMAAPLLFAAPQVHELSLQVVTYLSSDLSTIWEAVMDGVFWACRPKTIRQFPNKYSDIGFEHMTGFIFKKLMVTRNQDYYDSQHIKFWERSLKEVKVQNYIASQEEWEPCTLDCETFLNMLCTRKSVFELEWETS